MFKSEGLKPVAFQAMGQQSSRWQGGAVQVQSSQLTHSLKAPGSNPRACPLTHREKPVTNFFCFFKFNLQPPRLVRVDQPRLQRAHHPRHVARVLARDVAAQAAFERANFVTGFSRWVKGQAQGLEPSAFKLWVNFFRERVQPHRDRGPRHLELPAACAAPVVRRDAGAGAVAAAVLRHLAVGFELDRRPDLGGAASWAEPVALAVARVRFVDGTRAVVF
jgi:hypothetical protein